MNVGYLSFTENTFHVENMQWEVRKNSIHMLACPSVRIRLFNDTIEKFTPGTLLFFLYDFH